MAASTSQELYEAARDAYPVIQAFAAMSGREELLLQQGRLKAAIEAYEKESATMTPLGNATLGVLTANAPSRGPIVDAMDIDDEDARLHDDWSYQPATTNNVDLMEQMRESIEKLYKNANDAGLVVRNMRLERTSVNHIFKLVADVSAPTPEERAARRNDFSVGYQANQETGKTPPVDGLDAWDRQLAVARKGGEEMLNAVYQSELKKKALADMERASKTGAAFS